MREYETSEIKTLRDMLEHSAEYIGESQSRRKENISHVHQPGAPVGFASGAGGESPTIWVEVFGRSYRIDPVLLRARELEEPLGAILTS